VVLTNPVPGLQARILPQAYSGPSTVKVQLYTASFKLVLTKDFPNTLSGAAVDLALVDTWGQPLGNGLYYVVVTVGGSKATGKLVLSR